MSRSTLFALLFVSMTIGTAAAQKGEDKPAPQKVAPAPEAEKPRQETEKPRSPPPSNIGVKVEVTITDQSGSNTPVTKTLNIIATDRTNSQLRSKVWVPVARQQPLSGEKSMQVWDLVELPVNIDLRPEVIENGRVRIWIALNYQTAAPPPSTDTRPIGRSDVLVTTTSILESGKPVTISQSADAASDRKVTVELKATILR